MPGIGRRFEVRKALGAHGREREVLDGLDNPVELEGPQGAGLHGGESEILTGIWD
jgi:hypothetical protein